MKRHLDFVVIGAQKAGTTSLHSYLVRHPALALPLEKEAWYFSDEERMARGWDWYPREFYRNRRESLRWGKVTPQYMSDPLVPARLSAGLPDTQLVALLRDPVDRAWSHWRMRVRRGVEVRSFAEAVEEMVAPAAAERARSLRGPEAEGQCYVAWGEYGRILDGFLEHFQRERMLIAFTAEMAADPGGVLDSVTQFLGVGRGFRPDNLGLRYYAGGGREPWARLRRLAQWPPLRALWRAVPGRIRRPLAFWMVVGAPRSVPREETVRPDEASVRRLRSWYEADHERLAAICGRALPWPRA